jgi:hypothetical protein
MNQMNTKMSNTRENNQRNMGAFQRNNTHSNGNSQSYGSGGYRDWKNKSSASLPPKEKVLGPEDFPALSAGPVVSIKPKSAWTKPETTMAERMKEMQEEEERAKLSGISQKEEEEEEDIVVIPLSNWLREKYLAKKRDEVVKRMEMEEEEANYRWQISPSMFPPEPEPELPIYDEDLENEEIYGECNGYMEEVPEYEERI